MKSFRAHRRPGNRKPTKAEGERIAAAKVLACIPCYVWAGKGNMPHADIANQCAYDHSVSGRIRRGHDKGFASCNWHHQGYPGDGWNAAHMRQHFGPSLMDGSKLFRAAYGTDDELIELQNKLLSGEAA